MAPTVKPDHLSEEMIDATLADSFPASDPPSWTLGRERNEQEKIAGAERQCAQHGQCERADLGGPDQVRAHQDHHEGDHDELVVAELRRWSFH